RAPCDARLAVAAAAADQPPRPCRHGAGAPACRSARAGMNRLEQFADVLDAIPPWRGRVPQGYLADFLGVFTDGRFRTMFGVDPDALAEREVETRALTIADGEGWFEAVNWVAAAREARGRFVMVTLGACYGGPAVASCRVLQRLNPL